MDASIDRQLDNALEAHKAERYGTDHIQDVLLAQQARKFESKMDLETLEEFSEWFDRNTRS